VTHVGCEGVKFERFSVKTHPSNSLNFISWHGLFPGWINKSSIRKGEFIGSPGPVFIFVDELFFFFS